MVMFPVLHSKHSVNATPVNKHVTSRGLKVKKFFFIQITLPPLSFLYLSLSSNSFNEQLLGTYYIPGSGYTNLV